MALSLVPYRQISQRIPVFEWEVRERGGIGPNFWRAVCGYSVARMANINSTTVRSKSGFLSETVHGVEQLHSIPHSLRSFLRSSTLL